MNIANLRDVLFTALSPLVWGSTYFVSTEFIPDGHPLAVSLLRVLPAGLLLLFIVRQLPKRSWWLKSLVLGLLNFALFWWLLFEAAYRLPGGVAATLGATQVMLVIFLSRLLLKSPIRLSAVLGAIVGISGVGLMLLTPNVKLDPLGIAAALGSALSMGLGTVLSKHWKPPVSTLTFTCWQLCAGTILLLPAVFFLDVSFPKFSPTSVSALLYLSLIGAALTYILWFRGINKLNPTLVAPLGLFSPLSAVMLGWLMLGESLSPLQLAGFITVMASILYSQKTPQLKPQNLAKTT